MPLALSALKAMFFIPLVILLAPAVRAAKEVPPVTGVNNIAAIAVGSVAISTVASLISSAYCLKLPISALSNLERRYL